jgi:phospholipid-translocating ATPase
MIKFFTTSYMPMDKDIVREMWVSGDLKDRLGIKHRRSKKNRGSKLEFTPIFHEPHNRSGSEVSSAHDGYEPTMSKSPGSVGLMSPATKETLWDTPSSQLRDTDIEMQAHASYVLTKPSLDVATEDLKHSAMASRDPLTGSSTALDAVSPHPSYYSASDIPPSSPLPEPVYRYTTGEITSSPPTRGASLYTEADASQQFSDVLQAAQSDHGSARHSSGSTYSATASSGIYEMRVRSLHHEDEHHLAPPNHSDLSRGASETSYGTAIDNERWLADRGHDQDGVSGHHHDGSLLDDDQVTVIQGNRLSGGYGHDRPSSGSSWDGGRAL